MALHRRPGLGRRPLWTELARSADRLVGGFEACLVIHDPSTNSG